jgi:transcriptional regulator with XRE-family HTH domain
VSERRIDPVVAQLRHTRKSRQITQVEMARASGIGQSMISEIETGVSQPTVQTLRRYADALGLDIVLKLRNTV